MPGSLFSFRKLRARVPMATMDYNEALLYMNGLLRFGPKLGLDRFAALCDRLGRPQDAYRIVHVTGTKGKGSTTAMTAAILQASGWRTGGYFSPYVFDVRERIQVDGTPIPPADFARIVSMVRPHIAFLPGTDLGHTTEFELKTAVALVHFAERAVHCACLEVGIGGRLDATNIVAPVVTIITNIGLDHTAILGDTLTLIAGEKAGIVKPGVPCITAVSSGEALDVITRTAAERCAPLMRVVRSTTDGAAHDAGSVEWKSAGAFDPVSVSLPGHSFQGIPVKMGGIYQRENAACAVAAAALALNSAGLTLNRGAVAEGLSRAALPGRLQLARSARGALVALDGAHNELAAVGLLSTLKELKEKYRTRDLYLVVGVLSGHEPEGIIQPLAAIAKRIYACQPAWKRALTADQVAAAARGFSNDVVEIPVVALAVQTALEDAQPDDMVVVTGSFYAVGETPMEMLHPLDTEAPPARPQLPRFIDLSQPISHMGPNCPAHPRVRSEVTSSHGAADWQWETLTLASHTGSHLDAPLHKIAGGSSIDVLPLDRFTGEAHVADLRGLAERAFITADMLQRAAPGLEADQVLLIATGWGDERDRTDRWLYNSPKLTPEAADWLVSVPIRGLGIDHWGIGGWDPENDAAVHTILLGKGIWICEELKFPAEVYSLPMPQTFMALPVNLQGHSGAWCRPVIIRRD